MPNPERVDVVATVIYSPERLLTVYNRNWGAFTIPVTTLRKWLLGLTDAMRWELGAEAAMRNVAECLGTTSVAPPLLLADFSNLCQSDRDGRVKSYFFQVFGFPVAGQQAAPDVTAQWLTLAEIVDPLREPISPTTRRLVDAMRGAALARKVTFPPPVPGVPARTSVASIAVIQRDLNGKEEYLCQWNPAWERYFLVGGHQRAGENAAECMDRELGEELEVVAGRDFHASPRNPVQYEGWSTSKWQWTAYTISPFDVTLTAAVAAKVESNAANRWISKQAIRSERCEDGKLVSPTTWELLRRLGELRP